MPEVTSSEEIAQILMKLIYNGYHKYFNSFETTRAVSKLFSQRPVNESLALAQYGLLTCRSSRISLNNIKLTTDTTSGPTFLFVVDIQTYLTATAAFTMTRETTQIAVADLNALQKIGFFIK